MILLIVLIIICFVCLILIAKGIEAQCEEEGRQHRRELYKIWTGHFPEEENKKSKGTMKPFDKVLVRNAEYGLWIPALFGMEKDGQYITSAGWQKYCIPYEGNENLLGTKTSG